MEFNIYVLPVSGGCFVSQLGLLCEIYVAKKYLKNGKFESYKDYQPDICLCSSGGNVSAYVGMAADWSDKGIERISKKIKSEIFVRSWLPKELNFIPSWFFSFNGSIYKQGYGAYSIFNAMFHEKTVNRVEIWTGTYDVKHEKAQFFCNLRRDEAYIQPNFFEEDEFLHCSMPLKYLNNDLNSISEVSVASASIPVLVEHQAFKGLEYLDGGIMYPSPIKAFSSEICRIIGKHVENVNNCYEMDNKNIKKIDKLEIPSKKLRLIYFMPYQADMYESENNPKNNIDIIQKTLKQFLHTNILQDRNETLNILRRLSCGNKINKKSFDNLNSMKLKEILEDGKKYEHYILVLSPKGCVEISLTNIKTEELIQKIGETRIEYFADFWYI